MTDRQILYRFKNDYYNLNYLNSSMCIDDLQEWCFIWCQNNGFGEDKGIIFTLTQLAQGMTDSMAFERDFLNFLEERRKKGVHLQDRQEG